MTEAPRPAVAGIDLGADDGVRADQHALAALDAEVLVPFGNFEGDVALLPLRGAGGVGSIDGHGADRKIIAVAEDLGRQNILHKSGSGGGNRRTKLDLAGGLGRNRDLVKVGEGAVHGGKVLLHHGFAALAVSLLDRLLDSGDGFIAGQHAADGEEAGLHDGVDAPAHAGFLGHAVAVDHVEPQFLGDDLPLHGTGQLIPDFILAERAVEQENRAGVSGLEHINALEEGELVAGDKIGAGDQVAGVDRLGAEAQMGGGDGAGLLRVIDEVALGIVISIFADDLDGVFVGADGAVSAEAEEEGAHGAGIFGGEAGIVGERGVVDDRR